MEEALQCSEHVYNIVKLKLIVYALSHGGNNNPLQS